MKKLFSILIAAGGALSAVAQAPGGNTGANIDPNPHKYKDANLPRWVLDVNFVGGALMQDFTTKSSMGNYLDVISEKSNTGGSLKLTNGEKTLGTGYWLYVLASGRRCYLERQL